MLAVYERLGRFAYDEDGATAIEYGLIAALIAIGILAAMTALGGSVTGLYEYVSSRAGKELDNDGSE